MGVSFHTPDCKLSLAIFSKRNTKLILETGRVSLPAKFKFSILRRYFFMSVLSNFSQAYVSKNVAAYKQLRDYYQIANHTYLSNLVSALVNDPNMHLIKRVESKQSAHGNYTNYYYYGDYNSAKCIFGVSVEPHLRVDAATENIIDYATVVPFIVDKDLYEAFLCNRFVKADLSGSDIYLKTSWDNRGLDRIHRIAFGLGRTSVDNREVDHIYCSTLLNVRETMRVCSKSQNSYNKPSHYNKCEVKFDYDKMQYYFKCKSYNKKLLTPNVVVFLESMGYTIKKSVITSPYVSDKNQIYSMLHRFEQMFYQGYAYRPENDLSNSFYLAVMCFITREITIQDIKAMRKFELKYIERKPQEYLDYFGI